MTAAKDHQITHHATLTSGTADITTPAAKPRLTGRGQSCHFDEKDE